MTNYILLCIEDESIPQSQSYVLKQNTELIMCFTQ